ncbi:PQQ-dependent sugar dehydrogenase [Fulvivirga sedimenti]|uniref:PQQ-dependent sugar dehydrogenase n=1 Tax=Fulvivirga sedimenti TaxID=2879465 RepID=A0A9X1HML0_9BACT|nr:PQQ-dependent sugar dehydrogenase [Fulvivirga sedimenti]MCA6074923.1 PQQ-dependent sugar dehydrogenase [Fulvivirga sedimenti]MCA6076100.1 PQQ-dependent sugar dehydrogenase [Fulvivirga sedimenti]MCA6077228.1 PQQ-dependent sugar dehydrogenase [Fulvivirga sedimenti]
MKSCFTVIILTAFFLSLQAQDEKRYSSGKISFELQQVEGLSGVPWGVVWLEDGAMLVTERSGKLYRIKGGDRNEVEGLPEVYVRGQGGLMDLELHPDYENNGWVYITYSGEQDGDGGNTVLIRVKIDGNRITELQELFRSTPNSTRRQHFGGRIEFDDKGYLFLSLGERGDSKNAQDLSVTSGSIVRLFDDGKIPEDNPFVGETSARPEIWSWGHRNPQGLAWHKSLGVMLETEHGPMGGDELNLIKKGANYGWPEITYGKNYDGTIITEETKREGMEQPLTYWVPSIAPSSLIIVESDRYPEWKGHALVGSLKFGYLERVVLDGLKVVSKEKMLEGIGRIREVKEGPDGYIYILVEGKGIFRIIPEKS